MRIMSEKDFNFDAVTRFQVYQAQRRNRSSHQVYLKTKVYKKVALEMFTKFTEK